MSRQLRLEFPGALWHITSRGNERRDIVRDDIDRRAFVSLLGRVVAERRWLLHAWVLMSNHYHLLLETPEVGLSRGMKSLNQTYATAFNERHDRVGHLFQGRFKSILVERETHLLELVRYIVLNPVRAKVVRCASDYTWSNYRATAGLRHAPSWLEVDWTLDHFAGDPAGRREAYRRFVAAGRGASYQPWESVIGQIYLGSADFRERMQKEVATKARSREYPRPQRIPATMTMEALRSLVANEFRVAIAALGVRGPGPARKAFAHVAADDQDQPLAAIGRALETTGVTAWRLREAGRRLYDADTAYRYRVDRIRNAIRVRG